MKTISKITILITGLVVAFPFVNAAEPNDASSSTDATMSAPARDHSKAHFKPEHRRSIARIARKLNLNDSQVAQLKTIRGGTHTTLTTIRANSNLTPEQKKAQVQAALKVSREQMRAVLTPEQQAKLDEMKTHEWERQGGF